MDNQLIHSDPAIMMGKPVVAGTRITVELILEKLAVGETIGQVLEAHPRLTRDAIYTVLDFADATSVVEETWGSIPLDKETAKYIAEDKEFEYDV